MTPEPVILEGTTEGFLHLIYILLDVLAGFTCLTLVVSMAALAVQLVRKDQRLLVKKTQKSEGTYLLPHSPVVAPLMVGCYCVVGLATDLVLKAFLRRGSQSLVVQRLTLLLPMPLLLWAWFSACSNAFAWHLTPPGSSRRLRMLRFSPATLNIICWSVPLLIFASEIAVVGIWPVKQTQATRQTKAAAALAATLLPDDPTLIQSQAAAAVATRNAEMYYQAVWGIWAAAYGACWLVYAIYSSLLLALMGSQMAYVDTVTADWKSPQMQEEKEDRSSEAQSRRSFTERTSAIFKRTSSATREILHRSSSGSEIRYLSKRELLRRNTRLVWFELISFSVFTLCWCALAMAKSALGYRILNNRTTGPLTVIGELAESTIFGLTAVTLMLVRGINILRNRQKDQGARTPEEGQLSTGELNDPTKMDFETMLSGPQGLAARRGRQGLSITLNIGSYIVPSACTTPAAARANPLDVALPLEPLHSGTGTAKCTSADSFDRRADYFDEPPMPLLPRRKSSVTFADGILSGHSNLQIQQIPALDVISASPVMPAEALRRPSLKSVLG